MSAAAVETSHVGLTVRDVDRSVAFYQGLLGLELVDRGHSAGPTVGKVLGYPGAELDRAVLRLPQTNSYLELLQYHNVDAEPIDPLHGNPGSCHIAFYTDDLTETWETLRANGSELQGDQITQIEGGVFDGGRVIYCTDPDGIRVEFLEGPAYLDGSVRDPTAVPNDRRANETSHAGIHVTDRDRSLEFWVDALGFELVAKWLADDLGTRQVIGLPQADLNLGMLRMPATGAYFEVIEYRNAPGRHPVDPDHASPGAIHMALYVDDIEASWGRLEAAGAELISDGIVELPSGTLAGAKVAYLKAPDGFRVELIQCDRYLDGSERSRTAEAAV